MQFPNNNNKDPNRKNSGNQQDPNEGPPPQPDWRKWIWPAAAFVILLWLFINFSGFGGAPSGSEVTYDALLRNAGDITQITISDGDASGRFSSPVSGVTEFALSIPEDSAAVSDILIENGATGVIIENPETSTFLLILIQWAPLLLIIGFFIWISRRAQRQMGGAMGFGRTQAREYTVERPQVTFDDVAGQNSAKQELVEVVDFLREPDKYIALGARIPRGVLLVGPPGTGKTLLARAVAGEASVSFFSIAASEFVEMFVGVGASRVRDLFKRAKDNAPSIVFIDEIDAVGRQRGAGLGGGHDEREQTLNQMLAEMDGFDQTESVIVMAATNRPDVLDPALLRPGRFDRRVTVGLPDKTGRLAILKIHTRGKPLASNVELQQIAAGTIGFSGADLANLANEAALNAARRNAKKISMRDFSDAFDRIVLGTESPPLTNENERRVVAYHEAGHALVAALTPQADPVLKLTIVPRGQALGVTAFAPKDEIRNYPRSYLHARMLVSLGGRAAEEIIFDEITTGASDDLRRVTDMARRMVAQFGMSERIGQLNFGDNESQPFLGYSISQNRSYSEETAAKIDEEVHRIVEGAYHETVELLGNNKDKLKALADALLTSEVIEQGEMLRIIGISKDDAIPSRSKLEDDTSNNSHFALEQPPTDEEIIEQEEDKRTPPSNNGKHDAEDEEASSEHRDSSGGSEPPPLT
jgi:cell division protease FtsH